ncbi:MAG: coiled-coil domain-containing protein 22 [archaeon]|nr:coiled-coil domain-containing protein 22 [archaeon]
MNESEQLLVMSLKQMGCLPENKNINSLGEISQNDFGFIIIDVCNKIISQKKLDIPFPETFAKDMARKYQYSQKIVDFMKSMGYIGDLNLNNILFPSVSDMKRIFDFLIEMLTSGEDNANEDFAQNMSTKNLQKMKFGKTMLSWSKKYWIIPELSKNLYPKQNYTQNQFCLKFDKPNIQILKKVKNNNADSVTQSQAEASKKVSAAISESTHINFIQEEDNALLKYNTGDQNHNYIIEKIKGKNNQKVAEKNVNQNLFEILNKRDKAIGFIYDKFKENNFSNNVRILQKMNHSLYKEILLAQKRQAEEEAAAKKQTEEERKLQFKNKVEEMLHNFEVEKEQKNAEINDLNNRLLGLISGIDKAKEDYEDYINMKKKMQEKLEELAEQNKDLLRDIEDQMNAYEQMKKLQNNEIKEKEVLDEVEQLEKKYEDMVNNWNEYSQQAKSRINELKEEIDTKKKEYNYKYEQISALKKEIEDITAKIGMRADLAQFLNEEYQKIPTDVNRNTYINKISDITKKIAEERKKILNYINEQKTLDDNIKKLNDNIKRIDNELEDIIFQDAKKNEKLKDVYSAFIKLREGFNQLQKNIIDSCNVKDKMKGLENKTMDYKQKLQNYDMKQLKEQVEYLKSIK